MAPRQTAVIPSVLRRISVWIVVCEALIKSPLRARKVWRVSEAAGGTNLGAEL